MAKVEIDLGTLTNSCFVIMPFSPTFQTEYERIIRPAVEAAGLACVRADEIYSRPQITADIWQSLRAARVVVAELTGKNTNVFYEVGLAHALGKPVVIITRSEDDVPFDLKALRYLFYNTDDPFWGQNLTKALTEMLQKLLEEKEYGTVFESIRLVGKTQYEGEEILRAEKAKDEKPSYDLAGVWKGEMQMGDALYDCNAHFVQKGSDLSGTMIVSYMYLGEITVVSEVLDGGIKGDAVSLYGISYSYLVQGKSEKYNLDTFSLQISSEGSELSGAVGDEKGRTGTIALEKSSGTQ